MKRIICVLTVLCLLLTLVPAPVWAETTKRMEIMSASTVQRNPLEPKKFGMGTIEPQVNPLYDDILDPKDLDLNLKRPETLKPQADYGEEYGDEAQAVLDIRENLKQRNEEFTICFKTTNGSLEEAIIGAFDAAFDHTGVPTEGDYLAWQYGGWGANYYYWTDGSYYYLEVPFYLMYYTNAAQEAEMDQAVEDLLDALDLYGKSDYEKLCGVYDYITENIYYDYANLSNPDYYLMYTAYAALVNNTAVCQGYANLLYRLLLELDVDNRMVVGDAGGPHAWNIVQMGGWYYYADSTWDATYAQAGWPYQYFLLGSDNFTLDHTPDSAESPCVLTYPINTVDYDPSNPPPTDPEIPADPEIPTEPEEPTLPDADYLEEEWELLKLTNQERAKAGLAPLTTTKALFQATDIRALELMEKYAHDRPNGSSFDTALSDLGIEYRMAGENKDAGCSTPAEVLNAWMGLSESRGHILDSNYVHMGAAYKQTENHTYSTFWDQLFYRDTYCHYNGLTLNKDSLTVKQGTALEDMDLWGVLVCGECGECYLPVLEAYCSDFDPDFLGTQTVTVSALNYSDTVEITVVEKQVPDFDLPECLDVEWEVLRLTNRERHENGLAPLTTQDILFKAAGIRAEETTKKFEHIRPDNSNFSTVFFDLDYPWYMAGENIAAGQRTPDEVVTDWMNSPGHRANILNAEFYHLGVGYAHSDKEYLHYWTQLFTIGWDCQYTGLTLCTDYLEVEAGTELEEIPLWAVANCSYCGECYLPILPEYCAGYEPETPGTYEVTMTCLGLTDTLTIKVLGGEPEPATAPGDANGDGRINSLDVMLLLQYLADWDVTPDLTGADANGDGRVNSLDAMLLRQYLADWDVTLGTKN